MSNLPLALLGAAESYVIAFLGFSALIVLHEFGHFVIAKRTGMKATKFYLFFPPKMVGIKRGETEYGIGWLPLGGFVKIIGMAPEEEVELSTGRKVPIEGEVGELTEAERLEREEIRRRAFCNQSVGKRVATIFAGPAVNLLIAFVIFFGLAFGLEEGTDEVGEVRSDSAAAGVLEPGDRIVGIDGEDVSSLTGVELREQIAEAVTEHECPGPERDGCRARTTVDLIVDRGADRKRASIRPAYDEEVGRMLIGFSYATRDLDPGPLEASEISADRMWEITWRGVFGIFPRVFGEGRDEISSVVGIYEVTRQSVEFGTREALSVLGAISLVLAVINLMPFLPLDGGHIAWAMWEKLKGRRIPLETMAKVSSVGIVFLVFVVFIGLSNDIGRLTGDGFDFR